VLKEISGGPGADILRGWLASHDDPNMYRLAHVSLGFTLGVPNPTGRIVEGERTFGGIESGFDGCVLSPTIKIDGELLQKNGHYLHPTVVAACRAMQPAGW
jgi:leucyl aminopeptidase (aminopeptidase T)